MEPQLVQPNDVRRAFDQVLDHTRIRIFSETELIIRDLRDIPWTDDLRYYGLCKIPGQEWYCAKIDCSDYKDESYVGCKSEIHWPMFYLSKENYHVKDNGWPPTAKVVIVDANFHGSYRKDVLVDNVLIHSYHPTPDDWSGTSAWIHYNLDTGQVKDLG